MGRRPFSDWGAFVVLWLWTLTTLFICMLDTVIIRYDDAPYELVREGENHEVWTYREPYSFIDLGNPVLFLFLVVLIASIPLIYLLSRNALFRP